MPMFPSGALGREGRGGLAVKSLLLPPHYL